MSQGPVGGGWAARGGAAFEAEAGLLDEAAMTANAMMPSHPL